MPMGDELMLQALESAADQVDRLAGIIDEFLTIGAAIATPTGDSPH